MSNREEFFRTNTDLNGLYRNMLSGEFSPLSDPHGSFHTMAKLALSTLRKGEAEQPTEGDPFIQVEFTPFWALNILSRVKIHHENGFGPYRLEYVSLEVKNEPKKYNQVEFSLYGIGKDTRFVVKRSDSGYEDEERFKLGHGPNLSRIRATVAEYANEVFSEAHQASLLEV